MTNVEMPLTLHNVHVLLKLKIIATNYEASMGKYIDIQNLIKIFTSPKPKPSHESQLPSKPKHTAS